MNTYKELIEVVSIRCLKCGRVQYRRFHRTFETVPREDDGYMMDCHTCEKFTEGIVISKPYYMECE